jgi:hypothetical protein
VVRAPLLARQTFLLVRGLKKLNLKMDKNLKKLNKIHIHLLTCNIAGDIMYLVRDVSQPTKLGNFYLT